MNQAYSSGEGLNLMEFEASPSKHSIFNYSKGPRFGSPTRRKTFKTIKSVLISKKIYNWKKSFIRNQKQSFETTVDFEIFEFFETFCAGLKNNTSLQALRLSGVTIDSLLMIRLLKSIERHDIQLLDCSNMNISRMTYKYMFKVLQNNSKLDTLNLCNGFLPEESFRDLKELLIRNKSIKEVNLNFSHFNSEALKLFCEGVTKSHSLKRLKLSCQTFQYSACKALAKFFGKHKRLELLDLSYNGIGEAQIQILSSKFKKKTWFKRKLSIILEINLSGNKIRGYKAIKELEFFLKNFKETIRLNISKNGLTGTDLEYLQISLKLIKSELILKNNRLNENFPEDLSSIAHLQVLDLSQNKLSDKAISTLGVWLARPDCYWSELILSRNNINDKDYEILICNISLSKTLQKLDVSNNKITNDGLANVQSVLSKINNLKELNLSNNFLESPLMNLIFPCSITKLIINNITNENFELDYITLDLSMLEYLEIKGSDGIFREIIKSLQSAINLKELNISELSPDLNEYDAMCLSQFLSKTNSLKTLNFRGFNLSTFNKNIRNLIMDGVGKNQSISELDISRNKLGNVIEDALIKLKNISTLRKLNMSSNFIEGNANLAFADFLSNSLLEELDLSNNLFSYTTFDKISDALLNNQNLKILRLGKMNLDILCLLPIGNLLVNNHSIRELDFSAVNFHEHSLLSLYKKANGTVKKLILPNANIEKFQYSLLSNILSRNPSISLVNLQGCRFIRLSTSKLLKEIPKLQLLRFLNLTEMSLADGEISDLLIRLRLHRNIEQISLRNMEFSQLSASSLKKFLMDNTSLQNLDLSQNRITDSMLEDIKIGLMNNKNLKKLCLKNCQLNDMHLHVLLDILKKANINTLDLENNSLSCDSLYEIFNSKSKTAIYNINLNSNWFFKNTAHFQSFSFMPFKELHISKSLTNCSETIINPFISFLLSSETLINLTLDDNQLTDQTLMLIIGLLSQNNTLKKLSLASNKFKIIGIGAFFKIFQNNITLEELDFSNNTNDGAQFGEILEKNLSKNSTLQILNISHNSLDKFFNKSLTKIFKANSVICFKNSQWKGIKTNSAIYILESIKKCVIQLKNRKEEIPIEFKNINFSDGLLDDDFCIYFSENIKELYFIETLCFKNNEKITYIGLKFLYVSIVYNKQNLELKNIFFDQINTKNFQNNGIAASLVEWGNYGEVKSSKDRFLQSFCRIFFAPMITINNKFQYSDMFKQFMDSFDIFWIMIFFLLNYLTYLVLSLFLPIYYVLDCGRGHDYYAHIIYNIYVFITLILEISFWIYYKLKISDYSESEKRLKREVFISDLLYLVGSMASKYDLYLDICFITISHTCGSRKVSQASIAIVSLKIFIKTLMFIKAMYKLLVAYRKINQTTSLNLLAKLFLIQDFFLIADILDRYAPGNAKKFKRVLGFKLNRSIYLSTNILLAIMKFFLEDVPQSVLQCIYIFVLADITPSSASNTVILVNIGKNFASLLGSFYTTVSLRPSYIEQVDFDERLSMYHMIKQSEHQPRRVTSLLNRSFINEDKNLEMEDLLNVMKAYTRKESKMKTSQCLANGMRVSKSLREDGFLITIADVSIPSEDGIMEKEDKLKQMKNVYNADEKEIELVL